MATACQRQQCLACVIDRHACLFVNIQEFEQRRTDAEQAVAGRIGQQIAPMRIEPRQRRHIHVMHVMPCMRQFTDDFQRRIHAMAIRYIDFMGWPHGDFPWTLGNYFLLIQCIV